MQYFWDNFLSWKEENNLSEGRSYFIWGLVFAFTTAITFQGFYLTCYYFEFPLIERYKALESPWPWYDDPESWNKLYWRTIFLYVLNVFIIGPAAYAPFYFYDLDVPLDWSPEVPNTVKMCAQVYLCMLIEDLSFYCSHRTLHTKTLYNYVHKIHHEHKVTIGLAA